jgi:tetratricopeptide (TPR) repeat protein
MTADRFKILLDRGCKALAENDTLLAMILLEDACKLADSPTAKSNLAYCLAREKQQFQKAIAMCLAAQQQEPARSLHFLNLGRIYLMAGQKVMAIKTFRQGLKRERNQEIVNLLKKLGVRKEPPMHALPRNHFLNRSLGILLSRVGMR